MNLMPDMLQQFKDTKHGSPSCLEKEHADEHGNFSKNSTTMVQTYEKIIRH